jgi:hypothetical protein
VPETAGGGAIGHLVNHPGTRCAAAHVTSDELEYPTVAAAFRPHKRASPPKRCDRVAAGRQATVVLADFLWWPEPPPPPVHALRRFMRCDAYGQQRKPMADPPPMAGALLLAGGPPWR